MYRYKAIYWVSYTNVMIDWLKIAFSIIIIVDSKKIIGGKLYVKKER